MNETELVPLPNDSTAPLLIALDIDGTLLDEHHRVTTRTAAVLAELRRRGTTIAIATGRPVEVIGAPGEHADWLIGSNGATVIESATGTALLDRTVPLDVARVLATRVRAAAPGVGFSVVSNLDAVFETGFERIVPPNVELGRNVADALAVGGVQGDRLRSWAVFHPTMHPDEIAILIDAAVGPRYVARSLGFGAAEISEPGITKATALQHLVDHVGITANAVWAFGDNRNDHEMLRWAGRGHAMGNADAETKSLADVVVASNRDHGVAETLEALLR